MVNQEEPEAEHSRKIGQLQRPRWKQAECGGKKKRFLFRLYLYDRIMIFLFSVSKCHFPYTFCVICHQSILIMKDIERIHAGYLCRRLNTLGSLGKVGQAFPLWPHFWNCCWVLFQDPHKHWKDIFHSTLTSGPGVIWGHLNSPCFFNGGFTLFFIMKNHKHIQK